MMIEILKKTIDTQLYLIESYIFPLSTLNDPGFHAVL